MGGSFSCMVNFVNNTHCAVQICAGEVDPKDRLNGKEPAGNLDYKTESYSTYEQREEVKKRCSPSPFTLHWTINELNLSCLIPHLRRFTNYKTALRVEGGDFECMLFSYSLEDSIRMHIYLTPRLNTSNWMNALPSDWQLSMVTLPGTHNSIASQHHYGGVVSLFTGRWICCQDMDLHEQLDSGIRFLDIRARHHCDDLRIYHDAFYLNYSFDDVLRVCRSFLSRNSSETIVMRVREEYTSTENTRSYEETFLKFIEDYRDMWYLEQSSPTLGQVRGKIVLLRDFSNSSLGIDWASTNLQDDWNESSINKKWSFVENHLREAEKGLDGLYINFASASRGLMSPNVIAKGLSLEAGINQRLIQFFSAQPAPRHRYGIIAMDFPDQFLIKLLISKNRLNSRI